MLTIREPIQLKCQSKIASTSESFSQKILGNYEFWNIHVDSEELLHIMTQPPEVYLAEGGITNSIVNWNVSNNQEVKLEMLNHFVNRILLDQTEQFTYQDSAFISSVLRKMGITNINEFIRAVRECKEEAINSSVLTNMYMDNLDLLQYAIQSKEETRKQKQEEGRLEERSESENMLYLQDIVLERLKTGEISQELFNFYRNSNQNQEIITKNEISIAEQLKVSRNILLNTLKNIVYEENYPLTFFYRNQYEQELLQEEEITEQKVITQMNTANLLNIVNNVITTRLEQMGASHSQWYQLKDSMYLVSENTMNRFRQYHTDKTVVYEASNEYSQKVNRAYREEINTLSKWFDHAYNSVFKEDSISISMETLNSVQQTLLSLNQEEYETDNRTIQNSNREFLQEGDIVTEEINESLAEFQTDIKQNLDIINQKNIKLFEELKKREQQLPVIERIGVDRQKAQKDALRALENPQEVLREYLELDNRIDSIQQRRESVVYEMFSGETREIFERLEMYHRNPEKAIAEGIVTPNAQGMMQAEMKQANERVRTEVLKDKSIIHDAIEDVTTRYIESTPYVVTKKVEEHVKKLEVPLVHKVVENVLNEEMVEEIIQNNQTTQNVNRSESQREVKKEIVTNSLINTTVQKHVIENQEEIATLVQQGLQKQIGNISDQVYTKLERRLESERRRRGR